MILFFSKNNSDEKIYGRIFVPLRSRSVLCNASGAYFAIDFDGTNARLVAAHDAHRLLEHKNTRES
jgi:hypothetical protein